MMCQILINFRTIAEKHINVSYKESFFGYYEVIKCI